MTARVLFAVRPPPTASDPQPYQIVDAAHPWHKQLRPGFLETYADAAASKHAAGAVLGEAYLRRAAPEANRVFIRINRDGFRGPEIDEAHRAPRVVAIGDSCTFGTKESASYPRVLEDTLRRRGIAVDVINAGVEGYTPADVLLEVDRLKALRPEWTTVYLGWNGFFNEEQVFGHPALASWRLLRGVGRTINTAWKGRQAAAWAAYQRPKHVDRYARDVTRLDRFVPEFFATIRQIVHDMRAGGSRVVLFTLPGLFEPDREPTPEMLRIGHLPTYTDNPYVLAKLAARLNDLLRQLAHEESFDLIDLDAWSRTALRPREQYFFDSVHLTDEGQTMLGRYLADWFARVLPPQ